MRGMRYQFVATVLSFALASGALAAESQPAVKPLRGDTPIPHTNPSNAFKYDRLGSGTRLASRKLARRHASRFQRLLGHGHSAIGRTADCRGSRSEVKDSAHGFERGRRPCRASSYSMRDRWLRRHKVSIGASVGAASCEREGFMQTESSGGINAPVWVREQWATRLHAAADRARDTRPDR